MPENGEAPTSKVRRRSDPSEKPKSPRAETGQITERSSDGSPRVGSETARTRIPCPKVLDGCMYEASGIGPLQLHLANVHGLSLVRKRESAGNSPVAPLAVPPSSQPSVPVALSDPEEGEDWARQLDRDLSHDVKTTRAKRIIEEDETRAAKAIVERERLTAGPEADSTWFEKYFRVKATQALDGGSSKPAEMQVLSMQVQALSNQLSELRQQVMTRREDGHSTGDDLLKILLTKTLDKSDAETLQRFASMGLIQGPSGEPTSELGARLQLARISVERDVRREERQEKFARAKEAQEAETASRIVDVLGKGIDTVARPIAESFSSNVRSRRWLPGDRSTAVPQPQPGYPTADPIAADPIAADPVQSQLLRLHAHREEVDRVERQLMEELARRQSAPRDAMQRVFDQRMAVPGSPSAVADVPGGQLQAAAPQGLVVGSEEFERLKAERNAASETEASP